MNFQASDLGKQQPEGHDPSITRIVRFGSLETEMAEADSRLEMMADEGFKARFVSELQERVAEIEDSVLSLDVFDTFLLRNDKSEIRRFHEISERVAAELSRGRATPIKPACVLSARYIGTLASYRMSQPVMGCREGSIEEIYRLASIMLTGSDEAAARCVDVELEYEQENLEVHPLLLEVVERHVASGGKFALVSDMYLEARHIKRLVEGAGVDMSLLSALVSSADEKVSKRSGGVFRIVETALKATPQRFFHAGDSLVGDYQQPRKRGWRAMHLPVSLGERRRRVADDARTRTLLKEEFGIALPRVERPT